MPPLKRRARAVRVDARPGVVHRYVREACLTRRADWVAAKGGRASADHGRALARRASSVIFRNGISLSPCSLCLARVHCAPPMCWHHALHFIDRMTVRPARRSWHTLCCSQKLTAHSRIPMLYACRSRVATLSPPTYFPCGTCTP